MTDKLPQVVAGAKKRVGRGYGSGKGGHTVGRGQKGQRARRNIHVLFEGVKVKKSLLRRLPLQRGKDKFKPRPKPLIVNLEVLELLKDGSRVNVETLVKAGIVKAEDANILGVKVLGNGSVKKKFVIEVAISGSAAKKIVKAGGKVINA